MKIYIVYGLTGEYSSQYEWPVFGFYRESEAQELVMNATKEAARIFELPGGYFDKEEHEMNKYDANMSMDYTGTSYYIEEVEIKDSEE